jgi:hypothetical protein
VHDSPRVDRHLPVRVALAFAADEVVVQRAPALRPRVVVLEHEVASARGPVPIGEQQVAVRKAMELGIGDPLLVLAGQRQRIAQLQRSLLPGAAIVQRADVVIPGHVEDAAAVEHHADSVVRVLDVASVASRLDVPGGGLELSARQHDAARGVVERHDLKTVVAGDRVAAEDRGVDRVPGPAVGDRNQPRLLGRRGGGGDERQEREDPGEGRHRR